MLDRRKLGILVGVLCLITIDIVKADSTALSGNIVEGHNYDDYRKGDLVED